MAKYEVKMSCGHVETIQLFGKMTDRDRKIAWLEENGVCTECRKAQKEQERAEATAKAAEKASAENLPELTGSEKQINWALTIRAEKLAKLDEVYNKAVAAANGDTDKLANAKLQIQAFKKVFASFTDAKFWIDNRDKDIKTIINANNLAETINAEIDSLKNQKNNSEENTVAENTMVENTAESAIANLAVPTLAQRVIKIQMCLRNIGQSVFVIGQELIECKKEVGHGEWQNWLESNFRLSQQTARKFMQIVERFGKTLDVERFQVSQMTEMLSLPAGDEENFIAEKAAEGTPVEGMTVKKLREEIKKWKENKNPQKQKKEKSVQAESVDLQSLLNKIALLEKRLQDVTSENTSLKSKIAEMELKLSL